MPKQPDVLLEIKDLHVEFRMDEGVCKAVNGISFNLHAGRTTAVIGESGCGKSVTAHSILRIVPHPPARTTGDGILYHRDLGNGQREVLNLLEMHPKGKEIREIRGNDIAIVFQEPMTSFGPMHTIGNQIMEAILLHNEGMTKLEARERAIELLQQVGIPMPERQIDSYPHQFSGGMRQRAMIAMALSCNPRLLIADEPTTAVDVTIEAQILDLLHELQQEKGMAIMLITHNLAIVSRLASDIVVLYLGKNMEYGSKEHIFRNPLHPYTQGLWRSIPKLEGELTRLVPIPGVVPTAYNLPSGCVFYDRCDVGMDGVCNGTETPPAIEVEPGHFVSCYKYA
ncbi:MAG: ABC transporter ATP-binding protein [Firmicutes bacterium]|nr:ABC transporter ATP-binding protein [Bacillota bacterium]